LQPAQELLLQPLQEGRFSPHDPTWAKKTDFAG